MRLIRLFLTVVAFFGLTGGTDSANLLLRNGNHVVTIATMDPITQRMGHQEMGRFLKPFDPASP